MDSESANALEQHQVEHLVLLVGGNPLPNYVAAKLLVQPHGVVSLIYSEGTASIAHRLRDSFILSVNGGSTSITSVGPAKNTIIQNWNAEIY